MSTTELPSTSANPELQERLSSCQCGNFTIIVRGQPARTSLCHCSACQRRTGCVFGYNGRFMKSQVVKVTGPHTPFQRSGDSGGTITSQFCPECGSTLFWEISTVPDIYAVAMGGFADKTFSPTPVFSVYETRMHPWVTLPSDIEHME